MTYGVRACQSKGITNESTAMRATKLLVFSFFAQMESHNGHLMHLSPGEGVRSQQTRAGFDTLQQREALTNKFMQEEFRQARKRSDDGFHCQCELLCFGKAECS